MENQFPDALIDCVEYLLEVVAIFLQRSHGLTLAEPARYGGLVAPSILVLTPLKNAARFLDRYFSNLDSLEQSPSDISLGFLISDSTDGTAEALRSRLPKLHERYRSVTVVEKDFGFEIPEQLNRWSAALQAPRRAVLAKSRNHLLFAALKDEDWVLWIDVDVASYPSDVITQMLATGKSILHPNCVVEPGGASYDGNAWRDEGNLYMHGMRGRGLVRLEGVGGTMLFIKGDIHRDGLVFPAFPYGVQSPHARKFNDVAGRRGGEFETEGLALMAKDMGHECWGMPDLEIVHFPE